MARPNALSETAAGIMSRRFPKAFSTGKRIPLKCGILTDMVQRTPARERNVLLRAFEEYIACPSYLEQLRAGAPRINLDGDAVGEVSTEEALAAREAICAAKTDQRVFEYLQLCPC